MAVIETKEIDDFSTLKELKISSGGTGYSTMDYGAIPTISISDLTLGNITSTSATTYTLGAQGSHSNAVWTTTGTGTGYNYSGIAGAGASGDFFSGSSVSVASVSSSTLATEAIRPSAAGR